MPKLNTRSMSTSNRTYPAIAISSPRAGLSSPSRILKTLSKPSKSNFLFSLMNRFNSQSTLNMMGSTATTGALSMIQVSYGCSGRFTIYGNAAIQSANIISYNNGYAYNYYTPSPSTTISFTANPAPSVGNYVIQCTDSFANMAQLPEVNIPCWLK